MQPENLFCKQCNHLICFQCFTREHKEHMISTVDEQYSERLDKLQEHREGLNLRMDILRSLLLKIPT